MYKLVKLKKIANVTTGFPFKGEAYSNNGFRVVRGENVTIGSLRWDSIKCWDQKFEQFDKYSLREGDVVIGMDGSRVGKNRARITATDLPLLLAQRVACLRGNELSDQNFIYYLVRDNRFEEFVFKIQTGSSIPHISQKQIEEFVVPFPPLNIQKNISALLLNLDSKIELNNRINRELEQMAKLLYDYWFVQFEFPFDFAQGKPDPKGKPYKSNGGKMVWNEELKREIPEGWEVGTISVLAELLGGGTPKTKEPSYWGGSIPFFTPTDNCDSAFSLSTKQNITEAGLESCSSKLFPKGTIFITARGTVGNINIASQDMAMNQSCYALKAKENVSYSFLYLYAYELVRKLKAKANGSVFDAIVSNDFKLTNLVVPPISYINKFGTISEPIFEKILSNQVENQQLASLRDWLLPMLMNGQVTVGAKEKISYEVKEGMDVAAEPGR